MKRSFVARRLATRWSLVAMAAWPALGLAQTIQWNAAANGTFAVGSNWAGGVAPGAANSANFGAAGNYTVTFNTAPTNINLGVTAGNVVFSGAQPYTLTGSAAINGGSLSLSGVALSAASVNINGGSRLTVGSTSTLNLQTVFAGNGAAATGTMLVNGGTLAGSANISLGLNGGDGTLSFTGSADGFLGNINLAASGVAGSGGTLLIANTSAVSATGAIFIGTGGLASQAAMLRQSDTTNFTQSGAVGITIGAAANSVGTLDIVGGTFTSGTGTITINPTGTLSVGAGGVFNPNGNINVNGGVFDFFNGSVNFAANHVVTVSNGAQVLPTLGTGFTVNSGRTWNVDNSSVAASGNFNVDIGTSGNGAMIVNSGTIDATAFGLLNMGSVGATATLSLLNGSIGNFNSLSSTAGAARITVSGGSTLSFNNLMTVTGAGPSSITLNTGGVMSGTRLVLNNGTLSMADAASRLTMGSLDLQASGAMNVSGGSISIGTGTSSVAGTINLSGGSILFNGALNMNDGDIVVTSPATFQAMGAASLNNSRLTVPDLFPNATFTARNNSIVTAGRISFFTPLALAETGADLISTGNFELGYQIGIASTLTVRNPGTTVSVAGNMRVGGAGEGTLLLSDSAVGTISGMLTVAEETASLNRGFVSLDSFSSLTLSNDLRIASIFGGGNPPNGTVTIANGGAMTLLGSGAELRIGSISTSAGSLIVNTGGTFAMNAAATVSLNATGTIIVNGGEARLGTFLADPAGRLVFNSGTLLTNGVLNVSPAGALGSSLNLGPDRALHHLGTFSINGGTVALNGGTLTVGTFGASNSSINFQSGHLTVISGFSLASGQMLGSSLTLTAARSLSVAGQFNIATGADLTVNGGTLFGEFTTVSGRLIALGGVCDISTLSTTGQGRVIIGENALIDAGVTNNFARIELGGGAAQLRGPVLNSGFISGDGELTGTLTNSGELRADAGQTLLLSGVFATNSGRLTVNGGQIEVLKNLSNAGSIDLTGGAFFAAGSLTNAAGGRITGRGTLRAAGAISNLGTVTLSSGTSDVNTPAFNNTGKTIVTGTSVTTFFGTVTNNPASELRVSNTATAVFLGNVTGLSLITGGGVKIFEAGASGGPLVTAGQSAVGPDGNLTAAGIRETSLSIEGEATLNGGGVSRLNELSITGGPGAWIGRLDLTDDALIIDHAGASPIATIANQLLQGFGGGAWTGNGIRSSTAAGTPGRAIGFADATALGAPATFMGEPIDTTALLLRYTLQGDADLSGGVNLDDFTRLAANFGFTSTWSSGDFNYDGQTNLDDFTALAANFGLALPADASRAAVPEPGVGLVGFAIACTFLRRRARPR